MHISFESIILILEIYPSDIVTHVCKAIWTKMLFVVMFITAKAEKKPPSFHSYSHTHTHTHSNNIYYWLTLCQALRPMIFTYVLMHLYILITFNIFIYAYVYIYIFKHPLWTLAFSFFIWMLLCNAVTALVCAAEKEKRGFYFQQVLMII